MSGPIGPVSTLADLLPNAAATWPSRPCLATPDGDLSFSDVETQVDELSRGLSRLGIGSAGRVVVAMHKTHQSFLVFHALLRIGAVVIPIDPLMPMAAANRLLGSLGAAAIVVDEVARRRFELDDNADTGMPPLVVSVDGDDGRAIPMASLRDGKGHSIELPEVVPDDPAYVIFTSGSTGEPKGITHTHRSGLAYAELAVNAHDIDEHDRIAGMPPLHFDMSTLELYAAPLAGAASVPISGPELRFPATFTERSQAEALTIWYAVPFQLRLISDRGAIDRRDLSSLRHVIYAGEAFAPDALSRLMDQLPGVRFTNAYGPAETNVVTVHQLDRAPTQAVPIGAPWGPVQARVVDGGATVERPSDLVDIGDGQGELWVAAPTMMSGYLDRPDLTAERTVVDGDTVWYRTGDLVRRAGEVLTLVGRVDHQVKVRGVRLELEAIESALAASPGVAHAVVTPAPDAPDEHLVAAVVLDSPDGSLDQQALRRWMSARVPRVAVPAEVVAWDRFPLTSSGKIDRGRVRRALQNPGVGEEHRDE